MDTVRIEYMLVGSKGAVIQNWTTVQDHSNSLIPYGVRLEFVKNSQRITDQVWIQTSKKIWRKVWYNCN